MPQDNNFQHAKYSRTDPGDRVAYLQFTPGPAFHSPGWHLAMGQVGDQLEQAGVQGVLLISGHPYMDLFGAARLDEVGGLKRGYSRGISGLESLLALLRPDTNGVFLPQDPIHPPVTNHPDTYETLDRLAHEVGNFSSAYVDHLATGLHTSGQTTPHCLRYVWASVNHHLGRVEAAIDLLAFLGDWIESQAFVPGKRVLLIGHGHGGQVMALLSNMLTRGESEARSRIFEIVANYWKSLPRGNRDVERLERLFQLVSEGQALHGVVPDLVTLGTPVRCGWDTQGIGRLVHIVHHRPIRPDGKRWLSKMDLPQIAWEIPYVSGGDYVQQLAVAGTDHCPGTPGAQQAVIDLREIFEPYDGFERWLECARRNTRCQNDGHCLLVDYPVQSESGPRQHLYGHGCYTDSRAMLFLFKQIVHALYSATPN